MKSSFHIKDKISPWWQPKIAFILSHCYLCFAIFQTDIVRSVLFVLLFTISALGFGMLGHIINDWTDAETDRKSEKKNIANAFGFRKLLWVTSGTLLIAFFPWFFLGFDHIIAAFLIAEILLFILYSVKPFRVKERKWGGVLFDALYAYALPTALVFYSATIFFEQPLNLILLVSVSLWALAVGIQNIIIHQIEDYENDISSKTQTWVVQTGRQKARKLVLAFIVPLHLLLFLLFVFYVETHYLRFYALFPLLFLAFRIYKTFHWKSYNSFLRSPVSSDLQKINIHYHFFLPYWHLLLLIFIDFKFVVLLITHFIFFNSSLFSWLIAKYISPFLFFIFYKTPAVITNYAVFYYRLFFLGESAERARREHYASYIAAKNEKHKRNTLPNIAVANSNKNKYTETFVENHVDGLLRSNFYVHRLYGGNLPSADYRTGILISNSKAYIKYCEWKEFIFDLPENYYQKKAVKDYLVKNNITLALAEFGTCGVELYEICSEINIPLIVIFHGYDIHHSDIREKNRHRYLKMFDYAAKIIGVSKDIISRLKELGADDKKLIYLPCTFNAGIFQYSDHSKCENIFLAVGRFTETKSPHLTILAFNEVLKEIPNARLRMIGKDGGGELFEACHILAKALSIENKIDFLGVLSPSEVYEEMKNARVFVQHSLTTPLHGDKEGTPVSVIEAMACGLPVVATRHAGIAELIRSGENGILTEEYDYLTMAKEMVRVCKNDALVFSLGKNASESILTNSLITENSNILAEIIEKCRLNSKTC